MHLNILLLMYSLKIGYLFNFDIYFNSVIELLLFKNLY